ncbi:sigma factor-like helix-turn-helix DNA-binding protein [Nonomuraea sp. 3N208]|uniref:sigma factor-like helix-turn-helix DNA-binding protein n=1 Tax=Nonomuraea sp. 3N208 TaxID=3457421 RepID=UPI003FD0D2A2
MEIPVWRYGLVDGREHTLTEVDERYDIGRDRARRGERDALARMRKMATSRVTDFPL